MTPAAPCILCGTPRQHVENPNTLRVDPDITFCSHCDQPCRPRCRACAQLLHTVRIRPE